MRPDTLRYLNSRSVFQRAPHRRTPSVKFIVGRMNKAEDHYAKVDSPNADFADSVKIANMDEFIAHANGRNRNSVERAIPENGRSPTSMPAMTGSRCDW